MIVVPFTVVAIMFLANWRRKGTIVNVSSFVLGIYVVSFSAAIVLQVLEPVQLNALAIAYLSVCIVFALLPVCIFDEHKMLGLYVPTTSRVRFVVLSTLMVSTFAFIFYLPYGVKGFLGDIGENRLYLTQGLIDPIPSSPLRQPAGVAAAFFHIAIFFALFPSSRQEYRWIRGALLLASFSELLHISAYFGRTGAVRWVFVFCTTFLMLKTLMTRRLQSRLLRSGVLAGLVLAVMFSVTTVSRFRGEVNYSVLEYLGSGPRNFSQSYEVYRPLAIPMGALDLSLPYDILSYFRIIDRVDVEKAVSDIVFFHQSRGYVSWTFGTFVKSLMWDFGLLWTFVLIVFVSYLMCLCVRLQNGALSVSRMICLQVYVLFLCEGIFYFILGLTRQSNMIIVVSLLVAYVLRGRAGYREVREAEGPIGSMRRSPPRIVR